MRARRKIILLTGVSLLISAVSIPALSEVSVLFRASSGKVDIHLEEYMREEGKEVPWEDGQVVLPGGVLSKIPRICNDGEPCYVRAAVEFENLGSSGNPLGTEQLVGIPSDWVKNGNYFYYKNILPPEGTIDFFQGVQIPESWESGVDDGNDWNASVRVDAVQAAFFEPDFSSRDPWKMEEKDYEIQKALEETQTEEQGDPLENSVRFEVEQKMKGFSVDSGEFFRKTEPFVPGKVQKGTVEISNRSGREREIYMKSEIPEQNEFLKELKLDIRTQMKDRIETIYRGNMEPDELQEYQSIGKIPAGENVKLEFMIWLPEEADNQYSVKNGNAKFCFTTDLPENAAVTKPVKTKLVKTGDRSYWPAVFAAVISAGCLVGSVCGICRFMRKKRCGK